MGVDKIRFPDTSGIGIKPVSKEGTARIVRAAIKYAIDNDQPSVTLVHKGNIMKFTEVASEIGATPWPRKNSVRPSSTVALGAPSPTPTPATPS